MEIELKLTLSPAAARQWRQSDWWAQGTARPAQTLFNTYYDTPEQSLRQARMALRIRKAGRHWLQTFKGGGSSAGGLHRRLEVEYPLAGPTLDFTALQDQGLQALFTPDVQARLQPVFTTDFRREIRWLAHGASRIEAALDQGWILAGGRRERICELELELLDGDPVDLLRLARQLQDQVPVRLEMRSKAQRAFRLAQGLFGPDEPTKPEHAPLAKDITAPQAVAQRAWNLLGVIQSNEAGLLAAPEQAEYLHQLRVAMRQLRTLLTCWRKLGYAVPADLEAGWRTMSQVAGRARDWDVLWHEHWPALQAARPDVPWQHWAHRVQRHRRQSGGLVQQQCASQTWVSLLLDTEIWLCGLERGDWQIMTQTKPPSWAALLQPLWQPKLRRLRQQMKRWAKLSDAERHALRLDAKTLRYLGLLSHGVYRLKRGARFVQALGDWQTVLGRWTDASLLLQQADGLAGQRPGATDRLLHAACSAYARELRAKAESKLPRAWSAVVEAADFWRHKS